MGILLLGPFVHWSWNYVELLWTVYLENYVSFIHYHSSLWLNWMIVSRRTGLPLMIEHLWSLSVEEQFYLVWPVIVFSVRHRARLLKICFTVIGVVPLLRLLAHCFSPTQLLASDFLYRATPFRVDALLIGAAAALLLRGPEPNLIHRKAKPLLVLTSIMMLLVWFFAGGYLPSKIASDWGQGLSATVSFTLIDLMAISVLVLSLRTGSLVNRMLSIKPLRRLGQISYGFYVFHEMPHAYYVHYTRKYFGAFTTHTYLLTALIAFLCTLALSLLSFRYFEAPFLRLKGRFTV